MKQKMFGKKVQNWRRPLGQNELSQRFLCRRYEEVDDSDAEVKLTQRQRLRREIEDEREVREASYWAAEEQMFRIDGHWNWHNPRIHELDDLNTNFNRFEFESFLTEITNRPPPLLDGKWFAKPTIDQGGAITELSIEGSSNNEIPIEQRLAEFVARIVDFRNHAAALRTQVVECLGSSRNVDVIKSVSKYRCKVICLFSPFWVRSPSTWNRRGEQSLIDHLFVIQQAPQFLTPFIEEYPYGFKWVCWYILLAQGGSLKRAGNLLQFERWRIPDGFERRLREAPTDLSPIEACVFAEVLRLGGSEIDAERLLNHRAFVIDPTQLSASESYPQFWRDTVRWLITNRDAMTDEQADHILSWAMHERTEAERMGEQCFSWRGRRFHSTLQRSTEFHLRWAQPSELPRARYKWQSHGWDWTLDDTTLGSWSFVELTSEIELLQEGQAMRHCVGGYAGRCVGGYSAIVSAKRFDQRQITIEIDPNSGHLVQARGQQNRAPEANEQAAIYLWLNAIVQSRPSAKSR